MIMSISSAIRSGNKMLWFQMIKIMKKRMRRSYLLLCLTLLFCVAAITVALLMVRSRKLLDADCTLQYYGNYDFAFCDVSEKMEKKVIEHEGLSEFGYVYDLGQAAFTKSSNVIELGALKDETAQKMLYINPVKGRYPKKQGEICIDRIALKGNGFAEKLGQTISLSVSNKKGELEKRSFTIVGIIEMQKQQESGIKSLRKYRESMFSTTDMKETNFPFAYVSLQDAQGMFCEKTHILANTSDGFSSEEVYYSFVTYDANGQIDRSAVEGLHMPDNLWGREWTAKCIMGSNEDADSGSYSEAANNLEEGRVYADAYTRWLIPVFLGLITVIASIGIFDAIRLSMDQRREIYGILLGMGMSGTYILKYVILENGIFLILNTIVGWVAGIGCYQVILHISKNIFQVVLPSALKMDSYYQPYVEAVTRSPWLWSALIATVVTCVGVVGVAVDVLQMTPLRLMTSAVHKRKHRKYIGGLYRVLNRYIGCGSLTSRLVLYVMVSVIMSASVFGFLFFEQKAVGDTADLQERIEQARVNNVDYYMKQTDTVVSGFRQYMHQSGVTCEMYEKLGQDEAVEQIQGVILNRQTALIYNQDSKISAVLQSQSEYEEAVDDADSSQIYVKASQKEFEYLGVDTKKQEVFQIPTVGVEEKELARFQGSVLKGEIHSDEILSGKEVIIAVTDESIADYFGIGDELPLYDFVRPKDLDNSVEILMGQLPKEYKSKKPTYSVTAGSQTRDFWCFDSMKKISCRISAVVLLDTDEDSFFYDDSGKNNTVNILTGADTFKIWGLPDENYTRVGVRLKENIDTARFEQKWMEVLQQAGYMDSIDVFDIVREKQMTSRQIMAVFYAMICVLILLGCVCLGNSLAIRIRQMGRQQQILNMLGMTWWHLVKLYILRYARLGFFGACVSVIPPVIYSLFARKASRLQAQMAADDIVTDGTSASWIDSFPHYSMISGMLVQAVFIVGLLAVITLSLLVIFQSRYLKRVFQKEE